MKKKLLVISRFHKLIGKGYSITLDNIYKTNIIQKDYEIHQLCWHKTDGDELINDVYCYGVSERDPYGIKRLYEILALLKPDITVLHADPFFFLEYIEILKNWKGNVIGWFTIDGENCPLKWKQLFKYINKIITLSEFGTNVLLNEMNLSTSFIRLGVNHKTYYPPSDNEYIEAKSKLGLSKNDFLILTIGINTFRKGIELTLKSFELLLKKYNINNAYLYLHTNMDEDLIDYIEDNPLLKKYIIYSKKYNPFYSPFSQKKILDLYHASDVLFSTSFGEGFGMPFLEAAACKVPSVAPNHSSIKELVSDGGLLYSANQLLPARNVGVTWLRLPEIENAVENLYSLYLDKEKLKILGEKAYSNSLGKTWENTANKLKNIFDDIMNENYLNPELIYPEPFLLRV